MENVKVNDIVKAIGGTLLCGDPEMQIAHISIDSRTMKGDDLFVPLIGEKVDAHRFIGQAFQAGAAATLTSAHDGGDVQPEAEDLGDGRHRAWIRVEDTKAALQQIGAWYRRRLTLPLIGVTGSVGKTTTREMIAAVLSARYKVYKTPGNKNSQVGVPITLSEISSKDEIGVIELGISEPGEMARIAQVASVQQAVVNNIGVAHIEQLGSKEAICQEKLHIQDGMAEGGCLFVNGDDPILKTVKAREGCRRIAYGTGEGLDYQAVDIKIEKGHPVFTAFCKASGEKALVRLQVFGRHMVVNAMAALAVAMENGVPLQDAAGALEAFCGFNGRQQIRTVRGITVIDDSYNASPVSMKAGIQVLCDMPAAGRKIAVLADMKELGEGSPDFHREIGHFLAGCEVDRVALLGGAARLIGEQMEEDRLAASFQDTQKVWYLSDKETLARWLQDEVERGDCVLFKGSNSMGLGEVIKRVFGP